MAENVSLSDSRQRAFIKKTMFPVLKYITKERRKNVPFLGHRVPFLGQYVPLLGHCVPFLGHSMENKMENKDGRYLVMIFNLITNQIRPPLQHAVTFFEIFRAVIGSSNRVFVTMRKLPFYGVWIP